VGLLKNFEQFVGLVRFEPKEQLRRVWSEFRQLISLACAPKVNITAERWRSHAVPWAQSLQTLGFNLTTYVHAFVFHVGFWLETYGGIFMFATFATESLHLLNKRNYQRQTSKSHGGQIANLLALQEIQAEGTTKLKPQQWTSKRPEWLGDLRRYVIDKVREELIAADEQLPDQHQGEEATSHIITSTDDAH